MKTLSIIVPLYNEERTICIILDKIKNVKLNHDINKEIIVINDGSTDKSHVLMVNYLIKNPELNIKYITNPINKGKGSAIHTGLKVTTGEYLIIQDSDLEYDPIDYNKMLKPVIDGKADVVYGSRFVGDSPHRVMYYWHFKGNKLITNLSNIFTNLNLTDIESCYKLFNTVHIQSLRLNEKRFGFEPEVTSKIAKIPGIRIYEIGISYYGRTYADGKKIKWKDGFRAIFCILKYGLFR